MLTKPPYAGIIIKEIVNFVYDNTKKITSEVPSGHIRTGSQRQEEYQGHIMLPLLCNKAPCAYSHRGAKE